MPLINQDGPTPQLEIDACGDSLCSATEHGESCPADCEEVLLLTDLTGAGHMDARGTMFSIASDRHVVITSIDIVSSDVGLYRVEVFTKPGTYEGHESDAESWTKVYNNYNNLLGPKGGMTTLNLNNGDGVLVPEGSLASFFVFTEDSLRCRNGTGVGEVLTNDNVLEIYQGVGLNEKWAGGVGSVGGSLAFRGAFK